MAAKVGALAKQAENLQSRVDGTTAKLQGLKSNIIAWVAKGYFAKELLTGVVTGAVLLFLGGIYLGLCKLVDPAIAAAGLGGGLLLALVLAIFLGIRAAR